MKTILYAIAKKIVYAVAILLVVIAVVFTIGRSLHPVVNEYRSDIEKMASDLLKMPVTVNEVVVTWHQYQPGINLKHVTVLDKTGKNTVLKIKKIGIFFSIPQSIWHWKFVPGGLMLSGSRVNLIQTKTGEINLQGLSDLGAQTYPSETKFNSVIQWLSTQPRLILRDIDVQYTPNKGPQRHVTLYDLSFKNSDINHIILGKAILHQNVATDVTVAVQWKGQTFDLAQIKAKIYLYVSGFSFSQWLSTYTWNGWQINHGLGSAKIWATWNHNQFRRVQSSFQLYDLNLFSQSDKSLHKINRISGEAGWRREGDTQIFAADDLLIDLPNHLWPITHFYISLAPDAAGALLPKSAKIGYVDLSDVQPFFFSTPTLVSDQVKKTLMGLQLDGELQNASVFFSGAWNDWSKISLDANVSQLSIVPWSGFPGMSNLSGTVKWNGAEGDLTLHSRQVAFQYDKVFANKLTVEQLTGNVQWHFEGDKGWVLSTTDLQILNNELAANLNGDLIIPADGQVATNMKANFYLLKANHAKYYLPVRIFDAGLVEWLQTAFLAGGVKAGHAEIIGKLADFPFDNHNGKFEISAQLNNVDFHFAPSWPLMKQINGKILFTGRQIVIDVDHAQMMDIAIGKVHGEIPYLGDQKPQVLQISPAEIHTDFSNGLSYVHASPLEKNIGKMFKGMVATGPITITLGLTVPLANPDATEVKGNIQLSNNDVNFIPWKLDLNNINGTIHFTESTTDAEGVQALLFNKPVQFDLATVPQPKKQSIVRATFSNNLSIDDLENWLNVPLSKTAKGNADVKGTVDFSLTTPIVVQLQSNLKGIALDLPAEYAKKAEGETDFNTTIIIQEKQPLKVKVNYAKLLSAGLILNRTQDKMKLVGINLRLGGGEPTWPEGAGLYITGSIQQLDWDKIKLYTSQSDNAALSDYALRDIDVQIGQLMLPGQPLTNVRLQLTPAKNYWDVQVSSAEVTGDLRVPVPFNAAGTLTAQFERLNLHSLTNANQTTPTLVVKSLPSIVFTANNVSYNNLQLGQVTIKTTPTRTGATIQTLRIVSPRLDLQSSGIWNQTSTTLQGIAKSSKVSDLLIGMGLDASNFVSNNGELRFSLDWNGAFFAPTLASINGSASLKLGAGRIVDIGESSNAKMGIGRMLSIFSLQSIPRRLTLNFSDLFEKGYSFDSLTGDYTLKNGNAFTTNMQITGPVATVAINGRIGLSSKDYDFRMSVTPVDVTSSLPIAATLITGPIGGIAALAVNTVVGSQISKAVTYTYSVTGPWSNPTWSEVSTSNQRTRNAR